jgi:hypothetical protein
MTQCSCPFRQRNQVLVLSMGQELGSLKQKKAAILATLNGTMFLSRDNIFVPLKAPNPSCRNF